MEEEYISWIIPIATIILTPLLMFLGAKQGFKKGFTKTMKKNGHSDKEIQKALRDVFKK